MPLPRVFARMAKERHIAHDREATDQREHGGQCALKCQVAAKGKSMHGLLEVAYRCPGVIQGRVRTGGWETWCRWYRETARSLGRILGY